VAEKQATPQVLIYKKDTNQTQIALGVRAFNYNYPRRRALELLETVLGGMFSSRLMEEVRFKRGLVYDVHTELSTDSDTGSLAATANLDSARLDEGIKVILGEFKKSAMKKFCRGNCARPKIITSAKIPLFWSRPIPRGCFTASRNCWRDGYWSPRKFMKRSTGYPPKTYKRRQETSLSPKNSIWRSSVPTTTANVLKNYWKMRYNPFQRQELKSEQNVSNKTKNRF